MIGTQKGSSISLSKDEWHIFEIDWTKDVIRFAVDKQVYFEFQKGDSISVWPFDQEFHVIMNVAVGGNWGGQQGIDSDAFVGFGQVMEIDYVRVYGEISVRECFIECVAFISSLSLCLYMKHSFLLRGCSV